MAAAAFEDGAADFDCGDDVVSSVSSMRRPFFGTVGANETELWGALQLVSEERTGTSGADEGVWGRLAGAVVPSFFACVLCRGAGAGVGVAHDRFSLRRPSVSSWPRCRGRVLGKGLPAQRLVLVGFGAVVSFLAPSLFSS